MTILIDNRFLDVLADPDLTDTVVISRDIDPLLKCEAFLAILQQQVSFIWMKREQAETKKKQQKKGKEKRVELTISSIS